ncbi:CxC2 domain-containing protein [Mycena kentingensis (nom. inval.)]|nr:CxC2 domain-containing protein [Mycena kentingensis (nom. inval.)]
MASSLDHLQGVSLEEYEATQKYIAEFCDSFPDFKEEGDEIRERAHRRMCENMTAALAKALDFCGCYHTSDPDYIQLLNVGWYPATFTTPRTCATFRCLDTFQTQSHHGKTTAYDYYGSLETLTNAVGVKPPDRYKMLLRMSRQYRHLLLLKRGGRGYDDFGVVGTGLGELAIRCPACPRDGVNLPADWQKASPDVARLYTMFIALDACFRLKRRLISSLLKDPGLGTGWAYLIEYKPYLEHLAQFKDQVEISTCSGLAAIDHANDKFSRGYAATGVAMGICARHEFILPNGVGDLQRGERGTRTCASRMKTLPAEMQVELLWTFISFAVPKMHIKGHIRDCQLLFALGFLLGSGLTDGEGIERSWSVLGGVAGSTRVSGPGARADLLDDHLAFCNWRKTIGLVDLATQEKEFAEFSKEQAEDVPVWTAAVHAYENDRDNAPNPYDTVVTGLSEKQVRDQFEEEEAKAEAAGAVRPHDVGPAEFITLLLRVEEEQRRVHANASLKRAQTTSLKISLRRQRRKLNKSISSIRRLQEVYMPGSLIYLPTLKLAPNTPRREGSASSTIRATGLPAGKRRVS